MTKIDFKKQLKHLLNPSPKQPEIVDVPVMNFLMIDGVGDPNSASTFQQAVEALYAVAYHLKFTVKKSTAAIDYSVAPLEGLWWAEDMRAFSLDRKDLWQWTMMIMQPVYVSKDLYQQALSEVQKKKTPPALGKMRFQAFHEGLAAQIMHLGPYAQEGPTIARLHEFIETNGYQLAGKHHEIYLSDPRKSAPEKMKTIIRQPIK